jgi:alanyl-tRNA synthetase
MNFDDRGYLDEPFRGEFTTVVRRFEKGGDGIGKVWLERTWFYPESGGQPDDRGTLGGLRIVAVTDDDGGVCHHVKGTLEVGAEVKGIIDLERRLDHMQQHTGQHLLSRVFLKEMGLATVGFHLGEKICTIDLDGEVPGEEAVRGVETEVNRLVRENVKINSRMVGREEYEAMQGGLRSRLPEGSDKVRIVEIEDVDSSTCCGTHCSATGMVGMVRVIGSEKVRGNTRIEFICGMRVLEDHREKHDLLGRLSGMFSTEWRQLGAIVEKLAGENKALRKERDELGRELAGFRAASIGKPSAKIGRYDLIRKIFDKADAGEVREMASKIRDDKDTVILFGIESPKPGLVFACTQGADLDMGSILGAVAGIMGARGGGGKDFAQGGGGNPEKIEGALDEAERLVKKALS